MSLFEFVTCGKSDIKSLMGFLRDSWSREHIMANSKEYIDYFFYDRCAGNYSIIYALDKETEKIEGFIAYVKASFFDARISECEDFAWVTNWLSTDRAKTAGIQLYMKMLEVSRCKNIGTVGQNEKADKIYGKLKYKTGRLSHYYIHNGASTDGGKSSRAFVPLNAAQLMEIEPPKGALPKKTGEYLINKYLRSPYYEYHAYGIYDGGRIRGSLIFRVQEFPREFNKCCLRLVEYFGEPHALAEKKEETISLLGRFGAEYMDFYCRGIQEDILISSGFAENTGQTVIPNYFEPFVNKNIEIRYAYKLDSGADSFTVYKGDCDREHPRTR